jgi:hypothetical protein
VFGSFLPGISIAEAEQRYGPPQQLFQGPYYDNWRYARYATTRSFVDVAYEPGGSTCATYHRRTLYAYPRDRPWPLDGFLKGDLATIVTGSAPATRVLVMAADGTERVWCLVRDAHVVVANWHRTAPQ